MPVYSRLRKESSQGFMATGHKLEVAIIKFVMDERKVPKKWRIPLGQKIIAIADDMMSDIIEANNVYANTQAKLNHREFLQNRAMAATKKLDHEMRVLLDLSSTISAKDVAPICNLIYEEQDHIRKWKKTNKLIQ